MIDVHAYSLDRAERAMIGQYPLLLLLQGIVAFSLFWFCIALPITTVVLFKLDAAAYAAGLLLWYLGLSLPIFLFSYFTYGSAITQINRTACVIYTVVFVVLFLVHIPFRINGLLKQSDLAAAVITLAAFAGSLWLGWSIISGWFRLARLIDRDRSLLCVPFEGVLNRTALQFFCGLPPIIDFVRGIKARALLFASSIFFVAAFVNLLDLFAGAKSSLSLGDQLKFMSIDAATVLVSILLANWLLNLGRRNIHFSIEEITTADPRPPILFLRAFRDDQVDLPEPRYTLLGRLLATAKQRDTLDHILLNEGTLYGPMIALGNPKDHMPPYGAARGFFANEHWQEAVTGLARASLAVVISVDDTESIWWEIEHLVGNDHLDKTLFLVHPRFRAPADNRRITARILAKLPIPPQLRHKVTETFSSGDAVGFFVDRTGNLCVGRSGALTSFSFLLMTRWFLRHKFGMGFVPAGSAAAPVMPPALPVAASS